jgi:mono/diheme cytochrome c family protein
MLKPLIIVSLTSIVLAACGSADSDSKKVVKIDADKVAVATTTSNIKDDILKRWYSTSQKIQGKPVFKDNCASCHGDNGQGLVKDWKKADANGKFPAPPLNGTAHAWHHSKELLLRTVNNGGIPLGGTMPAFKNKLNDKQKEAVLAYVMSLWPDKTYSMWAQRNLK